VAGLVGLATGIKTLISEKRTMAYLVELDPDTDVPVAVQAFQYFPETLSDNKAVNWQSKEIPGGSLPLYQWTASGERTISFTAQFSTDVDLLQTNDALASVLGGADLGLRAGVASAKERLKNTGQAERNVDVRSAIAWLRQYMLPTYQDQRTIPPPKLQLNLPQSGIGLAGGMSNMTVMDADSIVCVMTSCDVTWEKFFPSGNARLASVSLAFAQVPQYKGVVSFPNRNAAMAAATTDGTVIGGTPFFGYQSFYRVDLKTAGKVAKNQGFL
jgi:hypothetical protein